MFVRFRQTKTRLQISLIETRRTGGKVRHEHIAGLGSVSLSPTIRDRIEFWNQLHQRLARLSNRVDTKTHYEVLEEVNKRVPMVTPDEQRQVQRENAEADVQVLSGLHDMNASNLDDLKNFVAKTTATISGNEAVLAENAASVRTAKERLDKIDHGETVAGGLGKPLDLEAVLLAAGWTKSDLEHARR
jgi:hypothetical protein